MVVPASSYTPQLRPLSIGEVLDAGFRLFRARFGALVLAVLVPIVPLSILGTALVGATDEHAFDVNTTAVDQSGSAVAGNLISALLQGLAVALAVAICFRLISAAYLGEHATVGESIRYGAGRIVALVIAFIVLSVLITIGLFLLLIPAIFFGVRFAMTYPAIVFERTGPFKGMGRSWSLTGENFWRSLGTLAVLALLMFVLYFAIGFVVGLGALGIEGASEAVVAVVSTIMSILIIAVTYPLLAAILTVMYYDLRVRKEGFDLQLLAHGVGADQSRFAAAPERPGEPERPESVAPPAGGGFAPPTGSAPSA
jgi:hypothetical protein